MQMFLFYIQVQYFVCRKYIFFIIKYINKYWIAKLLAGWRTKGRSSGRCLLISSRSSCAIDSWVVELTYLDLILRRGFNFFHLTRRAHLFLPMRMAMKRFLCVYDRSSSDILRFSAAFCRVIHFSSRRF